MEPSRLTQQDEIFRYAAELLEFTRSLEHASEIEADLGGRLGIPLTRTGVCQRHHVVEELVVNEPNPPRQDRLVDCSGGRQLLQDHVLIQEPSIDGLVAVYVFTSSCSPEV